MKTAEQILKDNGFFVMTHKEGSEHVKRAFIVPVIKSMEQYADEVTLCKTLQIHARDQQIDKLMEVIIAYDEILHLHDRVNQTTAREVELRAKIEEYKNGLE